MNNIIEKIVIKGLFHKYDLEWDLNQDVNILVGINGIGKSTILRAINALLSKKRAYLQKLEMDIDIELRNKSHYHYSSLYNQIEIDSNQLSLENQYKLNYEFITTFDVPLKDKTKIKQGETPLDKELQDVIYKVGKDKLLSFSNYRFKATNYPELAEKVNKRIHAFFNLVNDLFKETNKIIEIDRNSNDIIFYGNNLILLEQLSSGEKQILLILFTVFLMEEEPYILLMDEPEISLHIGWQQQLIDVIRQLNPNCQLIIATHSPSIFSDGWGDKLFFVDELIKNSPL